jgi:1-acyl-sn-glycerol-3-phosphate acyltransferase
MSKTEPYNKRRPRFIKALKTLFKPLITTIFGFEVRGLEHLTAQKSLYVSNHNIGALIESHALLFEMEDIVGHEATVFGFTHPSIFKIWGIKHYFEWLGSVPATYEVAADVFRHGHSLLIFPGGNKQALRPVWQYKENSFRETHGWAKIAKQNEVDVVPITYKGSHFVNPVLFQSEMLSKLMIFPWLCGLKYISVSVGQLLMSALAFMGLKALSLPLYVILPLVIVVFSLTSLMILFPSKITMTIHPRLKSTELSQVELEDSVKKIMDSIYD